MKLLVDIGNSRFKWTLRDGQGVPATVSYHPTQQITLQELDTLWREIPTPTRILVSNVCGDEIATVINHWCSRQWGFEPEYVQVNETCNGVTCGYENIKQLGVDRWLAIIAAWHRYRRASFIVDCGTATTIDILDKDGQHLGGLILPGLQMMQDMLLQGTHMVGNVVDTGKSFGFAANTDDAVANGCLLAVTASIDRALQEFRSTHGSDIQCLVTGGGSEILKPHLKDEYEYIETLVLDGLQIMDSDQ